MIGPDEITKTAVQVARNVADKHGIPDYRVLLGEAWLAVSGCALTFKPEIGIAFGKYARWKAPLVMVDRLKAQTHTPRDERRLEHRRAMLRMHIKPAVTHRHGEDERIDLHNAIDRLSNPATRLVAKCYAAGATLKQAGKAAGFSESSACQHLISARPMLAEQLSGYRPERVMSAPRRSALRPTAATVLSPDSKSQAESV